jgi:hypothetical protein
LLNFAYSCCTLMAPAEGAVPSIATDVSATETSSARLSALRRLA